MYDLAPSETLPRQSFGDPAGLSSFPKVLRRRLDTFFADENISPKADRTMWVKIAAGLAVLLGSWIVLYAFRLDSWKFVGLYVLGGFAPDISFAEHRARQQPQCHLVCADHKQNSELCLRYLWDQLLHVADPASSRASLLHQSPWPRRTRLQGRGIFRFTPHEPRARWHRFQHIYALFFYAMFSLDYVFVRGF